MKHLVPALFSALGASSAAYTIFQKVSVNGTDEDQLKGVRAPGSDSLIQDVNDGSFACDKTLQYEVALSSRSQPEQLPEVGGGTLLEAQMDVYSPNL